MAFAITRKQNIPNEITKDLIFTLNKILSKSTKAPVDVAKLNLWNAYFKLFSLRWMETPNLLSIVSCSQLTAFQMQVENGIATRWRK